MKRLSNLIFYRHWGFRFQVGRTTLTVKVFPFDWSIDQSLMAPLLYGFGLWVTKDWKYDKEGF